MKEKDLPIDLTKHKVYSKNAKKCVQKLLKRYYDEKTAVRLWEKVQLQYCEYLKDKPALAEVQQDIYQSFFGSFDLMGKVFDLNRKPDNKLASKIFQKANDIRVEEIKKFPASFRMGSCSYDGENGIIRYSFTQCPNAEFAKRHHMEDVLPVLCNCDHLAMQAIHATLIREGTCVTSDCCDYCIVGDKSPMAKEYEIVKAENGLMLSVRKD